MQNDERDRIGIKRNGSTRSPTGQTQSKGAIKDSNDESLVIVESATKAKTIEKYLGKGFEVLASVGHIMDLPKKDIGVELENRTFEPTLKCLPTK